MLCAPSLTLSQVLWSELTSKTESLPPLPTESEVENERLLQVEASKPKLLIKEDIPQRIERVTDDIFMVLPREAPLPTGTISGGFFIEETGQAPKKIQENTEKQTVEEQPKTPVDKNMAAEDAPVLLKKEGGGYEVRRLTDADNSLEKLAKKKEPAMKRQVFTQNLEYDLDFTNPENNEAVVALVDFFKKEKDVKHIQIIVSGETPPLMDGEQLAFTRIKMLKDTLSLEGKSPIQTVFLHKLGRQNIVFRVVY